MQRSATPQIDFARLNQLGPYRSSVILPAFEYAPTVQAISNIIAEYNLLNTSSITIGMPLADALTENDTFALAVRCQGPGNITQRYVLTPKIDLALLYPAYNGQTIYQDAVLEVWVRPENVYYAQLDEDVTIYTNILDRTTATEMFNTAPTPVTLEATEFSAVTTGPTNPFSDPLELAGLDSGIGTAFPSLNELPVAAVNLRGNGSPEGVVTATVGNWYYDETNEQFYYKETGTGNTGWKLVT